MRHKTRGDASGALSPDAAGSGGIPGGFGGVALFFGDNGANQQPGLSGADLCRPLVPVADPSPERLR